MGIKMSKKMKKKFENINLTTLSINAKKHTGTLSPTMEEVVTNSRLSRKKGTYISR